MQQDTNTVVYWEKVEAEKTAKREELLATIEALNSQRNGILARGGEGDETADADLDKLEADIGKLEREVKKLDAFLETMPEKKAKARAVEILEVIPSIEEISAGIQPLVDDVNAKTKSLIVAARKLYSRLREFDQPKETQTLSLAEELLGDGISQLKSYSFLGQPGMSSSVDLEIVLMQMVYDPKKLEEWMSKARNKVEKRIERMRHHAAWLADPNYPDHKFFFCPQCYGNITPNGNGKCFCSGCLKEFPAEAVPGAKPREIKTSTATE